jgi:AAA+ ATPase superfamily predicted ATPase
VQKAFAILPILLIFAQNIKYMTSKLIAREKECQILQQCIESDESEFVIVCGRRRIGKTFLVEQFFDHEYDFKYVGAHNQRTRVQLQGFAKALALYSKQPMLELADWTEAFDALADYLGSLPNGRRKVIFIDEMPWIDSSRSNFVSALEYFWNGWAAGQENIVLVATGSATSWMTDKLLKNKGGLHNRVTKRIYLKPFNLRETEEYLNSRNIFWDRYQILQTYMLMGGVPFYLKQLNPQESLAQNIDRLCFSENGMFRLEFDELYNAIFPAADSYIRVVEVLAKHKSGQSRKELLTATKLNGTNLTRILTNLERCGFIAKSAQFAQNAKDVIYRLADYYTLFYFKFIANNLDQDEDWWLHHLNTPGIMSWMGISFELICLEHHQQIKKALGISGMATSVSTWRYVPKNDDANRSGAQVDLVIERADRIINLCEIKFSQKRYTITKEYSEKLRDRLWLFQEVTGTNKTVVQTFVTTYGLTNPNSWSIVNSEVVMDDLFA